MINTAAILAAGLGSRIKESHGDRPKGFIQIDSVPIIERSIDILKSHGISNIFIGTGHHSEHYERLASTRSLHCIKNPDYENTGSFYTLTNMKNELNTDFLLLESDLIYEARAITRIIENSQPNVILASGETNSGDEVFIEANVDNYLESLSKDIRSISSVFGELVGISKISAGTYKNLCMWAANNKRTAHQIHYEQALAINSKEDPFLVEKIPDLIWSEIDTIEQYMRVRDIIFPKIASKEI